MHLKKKKIMTIITCVRNWISVGAKNFLLGTFLLYVVAPWRNINRHCSSCWAFVRKIKLGRTLSSCHDFHQLKTKNIKWYISNEIFRRGMFCVFGGNQKESNYECWNLDSAKMDNLLVWMRHWKRKYIFLAMEVDGQFYHTVNIRLPCCK